MIFATCVKDALPFQSIDESDFNFNLINIIFGDFKGILSDGDMDKLMTLKYNPFDLNDLSNIDSNMSENMVSNFDMVSDFDMVSSDKNFKKGNRLQLKSVND